MQAFDIIIIILFIVVMSIIIWLNISNNNINEHYEPTQILYTPGIINVSADNRNLESNKELTQDVKARMIYPNSMDVVNYNSCNKSLNELHQSGKTDLSANRVCNQLSYNPITDPMYPVEYYNKKYKKMAAQLNDDRFNGYNYNLLDEYGSPTNIGRISLRPTNLYPVGVNFGFN